ncbi:MOSC domain-containing protein [Aliishimia ponticola]|uniref:MOSC domain-containing protein n=1 Tax=Aliishimia ponticola TaxID=2499833 RepID=A0A4S4N7Z9_9RHOB|nr:MOSC domain-containing protein [Aliishimia ponticola]THH34457.1 MOSC domain-containing protein [Aliishimia ponticola]
MTATLAQIWRHPVKGIGCERLADTTLTAGAPLPGDRAWALRHERSEPTDAWQPRRNFLVVAHGPRLAQVAAQSATDGRITLTHPDLAPLDFDPAHDGDKLMDWVAPLWPDTQPAAASLVKAPAQGMADNGVAQVSVMNHSSLRALSQAAQTDLDPRRFRGNLWIDGLAPWEEFDLLGKTIRIGEVTLEVTDRITRCRATEANPDTGERDAEPVRVLRQGWEHMDFGVYATVTSGGKIAAGDTVTV